MAKRKIASVIGVLCLFLVGVVLVRTQRPHSNIGITFIGLTNDAAGLLGNSNEVLAVFSVTNRAGSAIRDRGFYYIQMSGWASTYAPLGSGSPFGSGDQIAPYGYAMILTRI